MFNQPLTVKDALNHTAVLTYDTTGKLITAADPLGNNATVTYNAAGQPVTVTSFAGTSKLEYTGGLPTAVVDALNNRTTMLYDGLACKRADGSQTWQKQSQEYSTGFIIALEKC